MDTSLQDLQSLAAEVKTNFQTVQKEWKEVLVLSSQSLPSHQSSVLSSSEVIVPVKTLQEIASQTDRVKTILPTLLNKQILDTHFRIANVEQELEKAKKEREDHEREALHWKAQVDSAVQDAQREKRDQLELRVDVQELTNQLIQQSDFCSSLGSACCTLLWRVSRQEDCIHDIVTGSKSAEFLELVHGSVQSYLTAYKDDEWPDQTTDEAMFILALCGTITNIAASAFGREHLASTSQGKKVIDTFVSFIQEAPLGKSANMKALMLMSLYNISINQKGVKHLYSKPGLISMLCWHLKEEKDNDNKVNTLRLVQSLVSDEGGIRLIHEIKENLPVSLLQQLTTSTSSEIKDLSLDLLSDLRHLEAEQ